MAEKITDTELKALVDAEIYTSMGYMAGELTEARAKSMDRYLGEPLGTEMEGRSQVQTRDVMDVIEWIMPSLIRIFSDQDNAVLVDPVGPEDEDQAEQETDYLNYLFYKKNPGFLIIYTWFKDALLQKNGVIKTRVEIEDKSKRETYQNLTEDGFMFLNSLPEYELIEYEEGINATFIVHDERRNICIDNIPPEDHLISSDASSIDPKKARFNAHIVMKSVSDLREEGFSDSDIDLMEDSIDIDWTEEAQARNNLTEEQIRDYQTANETMKLKKIYECYLKADKNGDGIAEMLKVFRSGDFIESEEVEMNPFNSLTPIILTHKYYGLSVSDLISDLQEIRTGLLRSYMDNVYQLVNGTTYYDVNTVNVDDMLTSKPYGIREVDGSPAQSILHIPPSGLPPQAFSLFELTDGLKRERLGDFQAQLDPNIMANANTGVVMRMAMEAKAKVEMIARIFAETGVKSLFRDLHELARKHGNKQEVIKLRNNWIPVNPAEWRERTDFTIKVGLGNPAKEEKLANLNDIIQKQQAIVQAGGMGTLITPNNIYESLSDYAQALGYVNADKYFPNPQMIPPPPPQSDPQEELVKMTAQVEQMKVQQKREQVQIEDQQKQREEILKWQELKIKEQEIEAKQAIQSMEAQIDTIRSQTQDMTDAKKTILESKAAEIEKEVEVMQAALKKSADEHKQAVDLYKAELKSGTDLLIAQSKEGNSANMAKMINKVMSRIDKLENILSRK